MVITMDASLIQQSKYGTMDEVEEESFGSFSSCFEEVSSGNSIGLSSSSDLTEDTASSGSSSPSPSPEGPLFNMCSLKEQLPLKRGLSNYYQGKSQSFTTFSQVRCLEDLVKPERPLKRMKSSKSCGRGLDIQKSLSSKGCHTRVIKKKTSRSGSFSSVSTTRQCSFSTKPPIPPHRTGSTSSHTLWLA